MRRADAGEVEHDVGGRQLDRVVEQVDPVHVQPRVLDLRGQLRAGGLGANEGMDLIDIAGHEGRDGRAADVARRSGDHDTAC